MSKIIGRPKYILYLRAKDIKELQDIVNSHIHDFWLTLGSIKYMKDEYIQTVVKYHRNDPTVANIDPKLMQANS